MTAAAAATFAVLLQPFTYSLSLLVVCAVPSGLIYHVKFKPAPADIAGRVTQRSDDTEEKVRLA